MNRQYSIAEARQDLAAIVRKLEQQPIIEITRRGKPVAVLISYEEYQRLSGGNAGFWDLYSAFLRDVDLDKTQIDPRLFEGQRSKETGRSVEL